MISSSSLSTWRARLRLRSRSRWSARSYLDQKCYWVIPASNVNGSKASFAFVWLYSSKVMFALSGRESAYRIMNLGALQWLHTVCQTGARRTRSAARRA